MSFAIPVFLCNSGRPALAIAAAAATAFSLSGCAYRDLKAPCARDEAPAALSYAGAPREPEAFAALEGCGALRPINRGEALDQDDGDLHRGE